METIKVNGRDYKAKELDFNFICELAENGINIDEIDKKLLPTVRTYVAFCMGASSELAGEELNNHVINGGQLNDIVEVFSEKAENSDFFQALQKNTEVQETAPKKPTKKKAAEVAE